MSELWTVARNAAGRPTLQHATNTQLELTVCGVFVGGWSRSYSATPSSITACKRCVRITGYQFGQLPRLKSVS